MSVQIILVDDQSAFRTTSKLLLSKIGGNEVVAEASSGHEFLDLLDEYDPDIVFMDIEMPGMSGIEATELAIRQNPDLVIIGLSMYDDPNYIDQLIAVGARGYLLKQSDNYTIIETILKYPKAEIFFSEEIDPNRPQLDSKEKTILVVDDFANTRFIIEFTLKKEGYRIYQAADGYEALQKLDGTDYDLIITDLNMPGMDGLMLAGEIKTMPGYEDTPVLLLSNELTPQVLTKAKEAGINEWVAKPFEMQRFIKVVKKTVK